MGVLEARKDAEKIGYPVVGETTKDADNIIDYDIREEQTKDISAEINANNQTTTGMANVIPGVNAPKLIESTSIISNPTPGYVYASVSFSGNYVGPNVHQDLKISIGGKIGEPNFTVVDMKKLKFPRDGVYKIEATYDWGSSNYYFIYWLHSQNKGEIDMVDTSSATSDVHKTYTLQFKKGDLFTMDARVIAFGTRSGIASPYASMTFTRLG